jgi:uncharacterized iron-regulated protein
MPWKQEGETVVLTMSVEDWKTMIFMLGLAIGSLPFGNLAGSCMDLVNRINEGNPDFSECDRDLVTGHGEDYDRLVNMPRALSEAEILRMLGIAREGK